MSTENFFDLVASISPEDTLEDKVNLLIDALKAMSQSTTPYARIKEDVANVAVGQTLVVRVTNILPWLVGMTVAVGESTTNGKVISYYKVEEKLDDDSMVLRRVSGDEQETGAAAILADSIMSVGIPNPQVTIAAKADVDPTTDAMDLTQLPKTVKRVTPKEYENIESGKAPITKVVGTTYEPQPISNPDPVDPPAEPLPTPEDPPLPVVGSEPAVLNLNEVGMYAPRAAFINQQMTFRTLPENRIRLLGFNTNTDSESDMIPDIINSRIKSTRSGGFYAEFNIELQFYNYPDMSVYPLPANAFLPPYDEARFRAQLYVNNSPVGDIYYMAGPLDKQAADGGETRMLSGSGYFNTGSVSLLGLEFPWYLELRIESPNWSKADIRLVSGHLLLKDLATMDEAKLTVTDNATRQILADLTPIVHSFEEDDVVEVYLPTAEWDGEKYSPVWGWNRGVVQTASVQEIVVRMDKHATYLQQALAYKYKIREPITLEHQGLRTGMTLVVENAAPAIAVQSMDGNVIELGAGHGFKGGDEVILNLAGGDTQRVTVLAATPTGIVVPENYDSIPEPISLTSNGRHDAVSESYITTFAVSIPAGMDGNVGYTEYAYSADGVDWTALQTSPYLGTPASLKLTTHEIVEQEFYWRVRFHSPFKQPGDWVYSELVQVPPGGEW